MTWRLRGLSPGAGQRLSCAAALPPCRLQRGPPEQPRWAVRARGWALRGLRWVAQRGWVARSSSSSLAPENCRLPRTCSVLHLSLSLVAPGHWCHRLWLASTSSSASAWRRKMLRFVVMNPRTSFVVRFRGREDRDRVLAAPVMGALLPLVWRPWQRTSMASGGV